MTILINKSYVFAEPKGGRSVAWPTHDHKALLYNLFQAILPLQGHKFRILQAKLMDVAESSDLYSLIIFKQNLFKEPTKSIPCHKASLTTDENLEIKLTLYTAIMVTDEACVPRNLGDWQAALYMYLHKIKMHSLQFDYSTMFRENGRLTLKLVFSQS